MAFDKTLFGGVVAPIVNPCGEDDSLDRAALEQVLSAIYRQKELGLFSTLMEKSKRRKEVRHER